MAEIGTTPNRVNFASAGAVRRRPFSAAGERAPNVRESHAHLIARLQALPPYVFDARLQASPAQLELQAEILRCNLRAVERYVMAFQRDAAAHCRAIEIDHRYLGELFDDVIEDLCGPIESAAEKWREGRAA
jgi:hypothetical protein